MYKRHVGYTKLCYRDINGVEHTISASNGSNTWEYCNSSGQAITTYNGSTRPSYTGLYTESGTNISRLNALKAALNQFATAVANETDSFGSVDNKISIVGFSSSGYNNTELLTGDHVTISYNNGVQKSTADNNESYYYGTALVDSTNGTVGTVNSKITAGINAITANGGTQPEDGLEMAYKVLTNRDSTTYTIRSGENKGQSIARNTIVIFFTDGQPGDYPFSNMYSEANDVVAAAKPIKDYGTKVFSIGVFGESDGNPLTYAAHRVSSENSDYEFELGWMETFDASEYSSSVTGGYRYQYLNRNWLPNDSTNYGAKPNDTIYDYMSVVSSNYPSATKFMNVKSSNTAGEADTSGYSNYLAMVNAVRGTPRATNDYYRMASNQDTLVAAFLQAVTMNNTETTSISLNSDAVLKDVVNTDDFDVTNATVTAKVVNYSGTTDSTLTNALTTNTSNGTVTVSGFDYSAYHSESANPRKLVVTITGLTPKRATGTLCSNSGNASIYVEEDNPTAEIASPTLELSGGTDKTYIIDFNAEMKVADSATKLGTTTGTNGDFNVANNEATYKLKGGMSGTTFTASYSGVDTAMVYGVPVGSAANTAVAWNKITTVPASSVYIDDDFASTITVGDGSGYNAQITSATSIAAEANKLDGNYTIQFHGSRIDVYCTTDATAAAVTARVKNNATQQYVKNLVVSNKFDDETYGTLYNVPTISVDCGSVGDYTLELTVKGTANYRFDGVRVYNPVDNSNYTGEAASEANATFLKVREQLLPSAVIAEINQYYQDKKAYDEAEDKTGMTEPVIPASASNIQGVMFYMDKGASEADPEDSMKVAAEYGNYGPKNEIYLKKGEGLSFSIQNTPDDMKAWIGLSAPEGGTSDVTVKVGTVDVTPDSNLTAVDMYYPLDGAQNDQTITIQNNGDSLIAITNVKITGSTKGDPGVAQVLSVSDAEPAASVLSAEDGLPYLAVTSKVLSSINAPAQAEDPQPTADPEPTPTQPGFADVIRQLFSSFVNALFGSIARLFGN